MVISSGSDVTISRGSISISRTSEPTVDDVVDAVRAVGHAILHDGEAVVQGVLEGMTGLVPERP